MVGAVALQRVRVPARPMRARRGEQIGEGERRRREAILAEGRSEAHPHRAVDALDGRALERLLGVAREYELRGRAAFESVLAHKVRRRVAIQPADDGDAAHHLPGALQEPEADQASAAHVAHATSAKMRRPSSR